MTVSEEYGGTQLGYLAHVVAMEEGSRASASVGPSYSNLLHRNGSNAQKAKSLITRAGTPMFTAEVGR